MRRMVCHLTAAAITSSVMLGCGHDNGNKAAGKETTGTSAGGGTALALEKTANKQQKLADATLIENLSLTSQRGIDAVVNYLNEESLIKPIKTDDGNEYLVSLLVPADSAGPVRTPFAFSGGFKGKDTILPRYADWQGSDAPKLYTPYFASDQRQPVRVPARPIFLEYHGHEYEVGKARIFPYGRATATFEDFPEICEGAYADVCRIDLVIMTPGRNLHEVDFEAGDDWFSAYKLEIKFNLKIGDHFVEIAHGTFGGK